MPAWGAPRGFQEGTPEVNASVRFPLSLPPSLRAFGRGCFPQKRERFPLTAPARDAGTRAGRLRSAAAAGEGQSGAGCAVRFAPLGSSRSGSNPEREP